jgi:hypothetical protein
METHNEMPKDVVEELVAEFDELFRIVVDVQEGELGTITTYTGGLDEPKEQWLRKALTTAYKKGGVEKLEKAGNFVDELYQSGNMGENEYGLLMEFFNEELGIDTPLPEDVSL